MNLLLLWQNLRYQKQTCQNNSISCTVSLRSINTTSMSCPPLWQRPAGYTILPAQLVYYSDAGLSKWDMSTLSKSHSPLIHTSLHLTILLIALLHCICFRLSLLASICIEDKPRLLGDQGCSVARRWAVAGVWQLAVEARPPLVSSALTALIWESHGGVFFSTKLGKSLFPL